MESETNDADGHLKVDNNTRPNDFVHGVVSLLDGDPPREIVEIVADCPKFHRLMGIADSKGRYKFTFNQNLQSDTELTKGCSLHASLEGYRSDVINLADLVDKSRRNLGRLTLQPISNDPAGLASSSDVEASSAQRKLYERALDKASKADWKGAVADLEEATTAYPAYASAWLTLGVCRQNIGKLADAEKAFLESAHADPKFALPLVRAAALESAAGNMKAAFANSQKAIDLNPKAFPDAYSLNAIAALSTQNAAAAEKSARAGLALDESHQYPELDYALGMVLYAKDDLAGAAAHFQKYIEQAPEGPNAVAAKGQLVEMQRSEVAAARLAAESNAQQSGPAVSTLALKLLPTVSSIQSQNAPLLRNPSAYTCLESVFPAKVDQRGHASELDSVRVDVAVSDSKEIYGLPDGKRFADSGERELLGESFATTGLFSSIARALMSASQFAIEPAGEVVSNGETLLRYNFRSLPTTPGWNIAYGKETGVAAEQGWFLVESRNRVLRRVLVAANRISPNLKLLGLTAVVDYEPETILGRRILLPSLARVQVAERSGTKHLSLLSFDHCRAFTAESSLSFDEPEAAAESDKPVKPKRLPPNLAISVSLNSALALATAEENDSLTATVTKAVVQNGRELIHAGAAVEGHVRPNHGQAGLMIQLDRVETVSGWVPFYAQLVNIGSKQVKVEVVAADSKSRLSLIMNNDNSYPTQLDIPGVVTLGFATRGTELPSGTQLLWRTQSIENDKDVAGPHLGTSVSIH